MKIAYLQEARSYKREAIDMAAMIGSPAAMLTGSPGQATASRAEDRLVGGMPPQCATSRTSFKSTSNTWHVRANTRRKSHGIRCESTEVPPSHFPDSTRLKTVSKYALSSFYCIQSHRRMLSEMSVQYYDHHHKSTK